MLMAPVIGSIYPFAYHYAIKLFVDIMSTDTSINYGDMVFPITLLLFSQLIMEAAWRIADIAELKAEPYVRRSLLLKSYNYKGVGYCNLVWSALSILFACLSGKIFFGEKINYLAVLLALTAIYVVNKDDV